MMKGFGLLRKILKLAMNGVGVRTGS